jgi:competence protein ComEA
MLKQLLNSYFNFSIKETWAVFMMLLCIVVAVYFPKLYSLQAKPVQLNEQLAQQVQQLQTQDSVAFSDDKGYKNYNNYNNKEVVVFNPFPFNPNTITAQQWQQMGLRSKTIATIINYRNKGGKFYKPTDIKKIWGITTEEAERLIPYIQVENTNTWNNKPAIVIPTNVNINTADANTLKLIPGLQQNGLAYKLVGFREKLGGFLTIEQIKETYDFTDSNFVLAKPYLVCNMADVKKLNINTVSDVELNNHPYIDKTVAKAIVLYRTQKGNYTSVADIKKIVFIKEPLYSKIAPYLTVE